MKVFVNYHIIRELEIEVDDRFERLLDDDWYAENLADGRHLTEELRDSVCDMIPEDAILYGVYTDDLCLVED